MKTEKESSGFKIFWLSLSFVIKFGALLIILLPLKLDDYLYFLLSFLIALFLAKNEMDKTDLENKIFELKQLIEKKYEDKS